MIFFVNVFKLSFLLLLLSLTACGENLSEKTTNEDTDDQNTEAVYDFIVSDDTLIATPPDDIDSSTLTYRWLMYGETVSENATFNTSTYSSTYIGEHIVTLYTINGTKTYYTSLVVDFGDESAADYDFTISDGILTATHPDNVEASNLTYQWLIKGVSVSQSATFDTSTSGYSGEQNVLLITYNGDLEYYVTYSIDFGTNSSNQAPVASFAFVNDLLTATSTDDAGTGNLTHTWFADNQNIANGATVDTSNMTGIVTIKLTSTDAENLSDSTEQTINFGSVEPINTAPVAVATSNITSGTIPLTVIFDASASTDNEDNTLTYSWSFSDGTSSNLASPSKTFNTPGNYTATLIVTDSESASTTADIINITAISPEVDLPPVANITKNISTGESPLTVVFSASASSDDKGISLYNWDFGDGSTTISGISVTHIYDIEGVYTATLTVTDDAGQSTQATTQITVETTADLEPVAAFTTDTTTGEAPLAINFNASTSTDDNAISSYSWNFGDGSTIVTGVSVTHTYTDAGVYTVTLTVTDDAGQSTQATTQITVEAVIDLEPIAAFTMSSSTGDAPFAVSFNASTSSDDNSISSYTWDFGDGSTAATGITTSHTYTIAGDYTVMLTVTDSSNQTHSVTESITVTAEAIAPTANFTVIATELSVAVDAITSTDADGDSLTYDWTFNDQTGATVHTASGVTVTYEFASEGIKSITLMVTDADLLTDTSTQSITLTIADDTTEPVNGNGTIIFSEDYEDQTVGENPAGWGVNIAYNIQMTPGATAYADKVRVVDDAPGRDGKALYVDGTGLNSSQNYSIMPLDLSVVDNVERVYVRYYVYATTNYIGNRALTPSGAQPNHNHFMSLGVSHSAEMRIGEIKGALGANEYGGDDIVPKDEYWYGKIETPRMDAGTWYCVESAFINDGDTPILRTWLDDALITEVDEASDWKNGSARENWLDGFFGGVQLGWGNFGTYDNELYFDDVIASNERIGCDDSLSEPAPTLMPSFEMTEESMTVTVDGIASTGSEDFTYEWDFDGEFTDSTSGSNASYTFTTAGDKTISLTLSSGNTTETTSQIITIVDSTYDDLLSSLSTNLVAHCRACHTPEDNKPIAFESADPVDVEAGMSAYILNNSAQLLIDTPNGAGSHNDIIPASSEQDWADLVYLIEAKFSGEDDNTSGSVGDGNIIINDGFEGQDADTIPNDWHTFLNYSVDGTNNTSSDYFALIDSSMAHSGANSIRIKRSDSAYTPAFIYQDIPAGQNSLYARAWMYIPTTLGGGNVVEGSDYKHAHFMAYSVDNTTDNAQSLRFGTIQDTNLGAFLPSNGIDTGTNNIVTATEINANEWICVEFAIIKNDAQDQTTGWVNGVEIFNATSASDWGKEPGQFFSEEPEITNQISFGWRAFGDNKGVENIWFDDIVVSDAYIGCN